jgi:O-methyltransferase
MHNTFIVEHFHWKKARPFLVEYGNKVLSRLHLPLRVVVPEPAIMGSVELRMNVFHMANAVLLQDVPGDFAEVGCNAGFSSVILKKLLRDEGGDRELHCFDSFEGLPASLDAKDLGAYTPGEMTASRKWFEDNFKTIGLELPTVHQGWFDDTLPRGLPSQIAFALIDADIYTSTRTALEHVYPRLAPNAICMFGVYCDEGVHIPFTRSPKYRSPGVKSAVAEFLADKPERMSVIYSGEYTSGYFQKK